ncbi:MAG: putative reverse transcriptase, partial [Phenylobacterium sp.]|nr:putative reverse transcriptase [Phenylobacterium sp.]
MSSRVLSEAAFARVIRAGDSQRFEIDLKLHRESLLNDAVAFAGAKPASLPTPHATVLRGKPCVSYSDFSTHLILRAIARHLQRRLKISLPNRDRIVRGVIESLMDATPMYVMRRDITSFYESIPLGSLRETLLFDTASSAQVRAFLRVYFEQHCSGKICGLPRGIGLSAVLAEIAMRRFDQRVREIPGVYKYFRFSDDMIIFSYRPASDLAPLVADAVPEPMQFNKTKSYDVCLADPKNSTSEVGFEFLGYRFDVSA